MIGDCECVVQSQTVKNKTEECCSPHKTSECRPTSNNQFHQKYEKKNPCIGDYERHMYESLSKDICDFKPKEPYQIPGYTGHVPNLQGRSGGTYGQDTHEALSCDECKLQQHSRQSVNTKSHICPTPFHEPYRIAGYTGHVPGLRTMVGGTYGSNTHKLLYSIEPYPSRQENLSPYRGKDEGLLDFENAAAGFSNGIQTDFELGHVYQKPDNYYYKPQYKFRIGDTYATRADVTLVDPCINEESKVVVSTRELDDTQVVRKSDTLDERVQDFPFIYKPVRHQPVVPGFDTYVDALRGARGQCFEFTDNTPDQKKLQQQIVLQKGSVRKSLNNVEIQRNQQQPANQSCKDNTGLPFGYEKYGEKQKYTNSSIYDFTSNYRRRQSTEWAPSTISRPDPPSFDTPGEIYTQHIGLLPGYTAHIPGAMFRCGKTFTDDSRDARRALRGDRF